MPDEKDKFKAREKKIDKMTKDGLTRINQATGATENISHQEKDRAFVDRGEREYIGRNARRRVRPPDKSKTRFQQRRINGSLPDPIRALIIPGAGRESRSEHVPLKMWQQKPKSRRLRFVKPLLNAAGGAYKLGTSVRRWSMQKGGQGLHYFLHKKVSEVEKENAGVETAHTYELVGEEIFKKSFELFKKAAGPIPKKRKKKNRFISKGNYTTKGQKYFPTESTARPLLRSGSADTISKHVIPIETPQGPQIKATSAVDPARVPARWYRTAEEAIARQHNSGDFQSSRTRQHKAPTKPQGNDSFSSSLSSRLKRTNPRKADQTGNGLSRLMQKARFKRRGIADKQKAAEKTAEFTLKVVKKLIEILRRNIIGAIILLFLIGLVGILSFGISSAISILSSIGLTVLSSYVADDTAIHDTELLATELEAKLDKQIKDIPTASEWSYIDEFRYDLDPIGHDPFVLMAYLTLKYQDFKYADMIPIIHELHDLRYDLQLEVEEETREDSDGEEYTYYILNVILRSKTIQEVIQPEFDADETTEMQQWYDVLMETKGLHQTVENPFDFDWIGNVTCVYGYRVNPLGGNTNLQIHRGLDIGVPEGTPIRAGVTGTVIDTGYNDDFGNYIVIKDEKIDRVVKYAHCKELNLPVGAPVEIGKTVIALSGNSGNSTGPHLHIEVKEDGQYQNPVYMVAWEPPEEP